MPLMTTYRQHISWPGSAITSSLSKETSSALSTTSEITSPSSPLSQETPIKMLVGLGGLIEAEELCSFLILKANIYKISTEMFYYLCLCFCCNACTHL